jgi:hypothetical protein
MYEVGEFREKDDIFLQIMPTRNINCFINNSVMS